MKTIAIITPKQDTFSNPTLIYLIEQLIEKNFKILFFGFEQNFLPHEFQDKIIFKQLPFNFYKIYKRPSSFLKLINQYYELAKLLKFQNRVKIIACVDQMGLVIAGRINKLLKTKIIYVSFEIFFEEEFTIERKKILKKLETKYSKDVDLVVIQDKKREELLKCVNNFNDKTLFIHIPVSPKPMNIAMNNFDIYNELKIPRDKILVVYSGSFQNWSGVNEIIDLIPEKWDSKYWLILHSHNKLEENQELKKKIIKMGKNNYHISLHDQPFRKYEEYSKFLSKSHIGIATYFPDTVDVFAGKNLQEVGLSSGKFSTYMMLGIPTITTANSIYKELKNKYNFGEIIEEVKDIPNALMNVQNDYNKRVIACKNLYENELNPVPRFRSLMSYIEDSYK